MMGIALTAVLGILVSTPGTSVVDSLHRPSGVIIESTIDSAIVVIDAVNAGRTPVAIDTLSPGLHRIAVLDADIDSWPGEAMVDTIIVRADTMLTYRYDLRKRYFVTSDPGGADVFVRDSLYGKTPLLLPGISNEALSMIRVRKDGYGETHPVPLGRSVLSATLHQEWEPERSGEFLPLTPEGSSVPLYLTGTATILSGAAAAYLKIKADNRYQQFLSTNDPAILFETHSIDRSAAVALVLTQLSVALFVYFILKE